MSLLAKRPWLAYATLALAVLVVWGHTVSFGFVYDDRFFITELESVRSLANVPAMFTEIEAQATKPHVFVVFRPLRTAHYALLYFLGGGDEPRAWLFHLANVVWHGAVSLMLFAAARRLFARLRPDWDERRARTWALIAALGFALHPVVSEVVCWAKALDDLLATFFVLAALRELLGPSLGRAAYLRALAWFALAVYAKESAVPFALLVPVLLHRVHGLPSARSLARAAGFALVAALYVLHRRVVLGRTSQVEPLSGGYLQTLVDMLAVAPTYLRLALGVPPFRVDYGHLSGGQTLATPAVALGLGLLVALVVAGFWAWRSARLRPVGFGLLWAGAFLLPASNLVPMMQYMAERFLYTSLAGLVLAGAGIAALAPRQRLARACAALLVVAWAALAWQRSWIWRDEYTLFVTHYQRGLRSPRVDHNAEAALFHLPGIERVTEVDPDTGRLEVRRAPDAEAQTEALRDFEHALTILPENVALLSGYAMTLGNAGRMPEAIATFERVVALKPDNGFYWQNLAGALLFSGELQRARAAAQRAAELLPESAAVRELLRELEKRGG